MSQERNQHSDHPFWADLLVLLALAALVIGVADVVKQWEQPFRQNVEISLSPWMLPQYTLFSLARGLAAFALSLLFTLIIAKWAYSSVAAARIILPVLDILQSIPVLGFLPGLVLALVHFFPGTNFGLELACVVMIFTGQVWNLTFSFYDSLTAVPPDYRAVGQLSGFTDWQKFRQIELPFGTPGLVYNGMISMAGGWFFLTINEAFQLGEQDFRLPGLGSYMSVAHDKGDIASQVYAVLAMVTMIVAVDQLMWRPLVVWAQRFKVEDTAAAQPEQSWILEVLRSSRFGFQLIDWFAAWIERDPVGFKRVVKRIEPARKATQPWIFRALMVAGAVMMLILLGQLARLLFSVRGAEWLEVLKCAGLTFLRVTGAVALGTLWAVPVGVWIGLNPKWSRLLQPVTQVAASFPAPMLFPLVAGVFMACGASFQWVAVVLIMLGTQWYVLFNVMSGARCIPEDLRACTELMRLGRWDRWRTLYLPGVFPSLVTGWITAAGGAWNASIVAESFRDHGQVMRATGLGELISRATEQANFGLLAAGVITMVVIVVGWNRMVWKPLQRLADAHYRLLA